MLSSLAELEKELARKAGDVAWLLHPESWFELVPAARLSAAADARMRIALHDETEDTCPMARLPIAEFTAAYETIRDWWPQLSGEDRPTSLAASAYEDLAAGLRDELKTAADSRIHEGERGEARLRFPPIEHDLLATPERALAFWRAFLHLDDSDSLQAAAAAFANRDDAMDLARKHAWFRVLLQRQLVLRWNPDVQRLLTAVYEDTTARQALVDAEHAAFAPIGLEWLTAQNVEDLGLLTPAPRSRPFKIKRRHQATAAQRDAAEITVLIPSYKHEQYIASTIHSVLGQTVPELRVLVVDDRSPDGTVAAAEATDDPRLEVRTNPENVGLGNSVLNALESIDTPFVALLNSDDLFHPQRLEKCLAVLREDPECELVSTGLAIIDQNDKRLTTNNTSTLFHGRNVRDWVHWYDSTKPRSTTATGLFGALLERNFLATSSNIVCRTDWLRERRDALRSLKYCLDWQLFLDGARERKLRWLPDRLIAYRLHPSNTVWFDNEARWAYSLEVNRVAARAIRDHIAEFPDDSAERVELALRDIAEHLRRNTEVDWIGLYLNELIGGFRLEHHARESSAIADLAANLERLAWQKNDPTTAAERRRARALASKYTATTDEVYSLRSRDEWQKKRIDDDAARLRGIESDLHVAQNRLDAAERELTTKQEQVTQLDARLQQLQNDHDATTAALRELENQAASTLAALEAAETGLNTSREELEGTRAELAATREQLVATQGSLAEAERELATAEAMRDELHATLERDREDFERQRQNFARGTESRIRAQHELATRLAQRELETEVQSDAVVQFRGIRLMPGGTTRKLLRRVGKWRRKLGGALATLRPAWASPVVTPPVVIAVASDPGDRADIRRFCAEAAAEPRAILLRDGTLPAGSKQPAPGRDEIATWVFPERARRDWRYFRNRARERCDALLEGLRTEYGGDEARAFAVIAEHLAFARQAQRSEVRLLLAGGNGSELVRAAIAAQLIGVPWAGFVRTLTAADDSQTRWLKRAFSDAGLLIPRSPTLHAALLGNDAAANRVVMRPAPVVECEPQAWTEGRPHLLVMAPMTDDPGWDHLLGATVDLRNRGWEVELDVLGTVDPRSASARACAANVQATVAAFDIPGHVTVAAASATAADRERQCRELFARRPAVLVAPWTRQCPAPLDGGVLTAMAAGLPVIGTATAAVTDAARADHDGVIVPPGKVHHLTNQLAQLLKDPLRQQELGASGRTRYLAEFASERTRATIAERLRLLLPR